MDLQAGHREFPMLGKRNVRATVRDTKQLPPDGWNERRELLVDIHCGTRVWTMLLRLQKAKSGEVYVTRGYDAAPPLRGCGSRNYARRSTASACSAVNENGPRQRRGDSRHVTLKISGGTL